MKKKLQQRFDSSEIGHIYLLPNSFTAGNLFFGFLAILRCIQANYATDLEVVSTYFTQAVWFILFSIICDMLDGRVARLGGRESLFGKEFDSIADVVSFGVAPSLMVLFLILQPTSKYPFFLQIGWLIAFIYLLCSSVRLARFNVLTHPTLTLVEQKKEAKDFNGLPVPVAAGMIASLVLVLNKLELQTLSILLPLLMLAIAGLMVSNIPYPSFKEIDWHTSMRFGNFIYLILSLAIIFIIKELSFALLFLSYIIYGPLRHIYRSYNKRKSVRAVGE